MEYRFMGKTGLRLSCLSIGSWMTYGGYVQSSDVSFQCIKAAVDGGVNFIDTAEAYAAGRGEVEVGEAIKRGGWKRQDLVVSTKLFWGGSNVNARGLSRKHIVEGTQASLARMGLEYVDLLFAHRPDPDTPMEEVVRAFNHVIDRGWAFYWGTSEWSAAEIAMAHAVAQRLNLIGPSVEQPEYSLLTRNRVESEYLPLYDTHGLGLTTWSPLAYGVLSGKYSEGVPSDARMAQSLPMSQKLRQELESPEGQARVEKARKLAVVAGELGCTSAQLALAWCVSNKRVTSVIMGASRPSQVEENLASLSVLPRITGEVTEKLDAIFTPPKKRDNYR